MTTTDRPADGHDPTDPLLLAYLKATAPRTRPAHLSDPFAFAQQVRERMAARRARRTRAVLTAAGVAALLAVGAAAVYYLASAPKPPDKPQGPLTVGGKPAVEPDDAPAGAESGRDNVQLAMTDSVRPEFEFREKVAVRTGPFEVFSLDRYRHRTTAVTRRTHGWVYAIDRDGATLLYRLAACQEPGRLAGVEEAAFDDQPCLTFFVTVLTSEERPGLLSPKDQPAAWLTPEETARLQTVGTPGSPTPEVMAVLRAALDRLRLPGGYDLPADGVRCYRHLEATRPASGDRP